LGQDFDPVAGEGGRRWARKALNRYLAIADDENSRGLQGDAGGGEGRSSRLPFPTSLQWAPERDVQAQNAHDQPGHRNEDNPSRLDRPSEDDLALAGLH
jgi:hypothetical protein